MEELKEEELKVVAGGVETASGYRCLHCSNCFAPNFIMKHLELAHGIKEAVFNKDYEQV